MKNLWRRYPDYLVVKWATDYSAFKHVGNELYQEDYYVKPDRFMKCTIKHEKDSQVSGNFLLTLGARGISKQTFALMLLVGSINQNKGGYNAPL